MLWEPDKGLWYVGSHAMYLSPMCDAATWEAHVSLDQWAVKTNFVTSDMFWEYC